MRHTVRGFTLVEILLVLVLASVLIALVAPLGVAQVDKANAQSEWLTLARHVGRLSMDAFLRSDFVTLRADGQQLSWASDRGAPGVMDFEHLFFSPVQTVTINPNGISDQPQIELVQRGRPRSLVLRPEGVE